MKNFLRKIKNWIIGLIIGGVCFAAVDLTTNDISVDKLKAKYDVSELKDKYQLDGAFLKKKDIKNAELDKYKNEPKDEIEIILGNASNAEFTPNIELKRWNEVSFKIKPKGLDKIKTKDKALKLEGDKIKFDTPDMSFEMYEYEDGFKYVWYLNKKPKSNIVKFDIESEGLDFFFQPPLTQEEIDKGAFRPENVVGSYAVYHQTKGGLVDGWGKDYKTGKAFHIYRPHLIDANGLEAWGILHIENGIYSVEIPQDFLDKAIYPIKSNDTFGYESAGASSDSWAYEITPNDSFYFYRYGEGAISEYWYKSTGNWTAPAWATSVDVRCWGGGGAGGGLTSDNVIARGGGGAGGQYVIKTIDVTPGDNYAVVIGAGGAGSTEDGTAGGDSSFGTTTAVAKGGTFGKSYENGGAGGLGTTTSGVGDTVYRGGNGSNGGAVSTGGAGGGGAGTTGNGGDASGNTAGAGTSLYGGNGGAGITINGNGNLGRVYGGAGGGGANVVSTSVTNRSGGGGAKGLCIVTIATSSLPVMAGNLDSISAYIGRDVGSTFMDPVLNVKAFLNEIDSGGAGSHGQIAATTETTNLTISTSSWQVFNASSPAFSLNNWIIDIMADPTLTDTSASSTSARLFCDVVAGNTYDDYYSTTTPYITPENPWISDGNSFAQRFSIYATYTAAGAAPYINRSQILEEE